MSLNEKYFNTVKETVEKFAIALFGDRSWPDAAFLVEKGAKKDDAGKTLQAYRHLPHHNKNVKSPTENTSVDIPHLRNALARVNQVKPLIENKVGFISRAKSHLEAHAKALLKTRKEKASMKEVKELEDLCMEFDISLEDESNAAIKVMKNGDADMPYCVMQNGKKVKCYAMMKEAQNHMKQIMKG